ncbi:MAG: hypothetical protein ABI831_19620 [Betaproteobacteria bacterium]
MTTTAAYAFRFREPADVDATWPGGWVLESGEGETLVTHAALADLKPFKQQPQILDALRMGDGKAVLPIVTHVLGETGSCTIEPLVTPDGGAHTAETTEYRILITS